MYNPLLSPIRKESIVLPDYDRLWKDIISDLFEEFLLFFAPELYEKVDFSQAPLSREQELHKLIPASKTKERRVDKLVGLKLKNGQEQWILVHIEVQGQKETDFPQRMFQYFYRALDRYDQMLYSIALFTDGSPTFKPDTYNYQFLGTELMYKYNTFKILDQDEYHLLQSNNPFALVILAGLYVIKSKKKHNLKYRYKRKLMRLLQKTSIAKSKVHRLFLFIDYVIELEEFESEQFALEIKPFIEEVPSMALSFDDSPTIKAYKKILKDEGRKEGKEEGKRENSIEIARRMLSEGFTIDVIAKLTGLTREEIEEL